MKSKSRQWKKAPPTPKCLRLWLESEKNLPCRPPPTGHWWCLAKGLNCNPQVCTGARQPQPGTGVEKTEGNSVTGVKILTICQPPCSPVNVQQCAGDRILLLELVFMPWKPWNRTDWWDLTKLLALMKRTSKGKMGLSSGFGYTDFGYQYSSWHHHSSFFHSSLEGLASIFLRAEYKLWVLSLQQECVNEWVKKGWIKDICSFV